MPPLLNKDPEIPSRLYSIESFEKMSKKNWRKAGKPKWWVRIGQGLAFRFLDTTPNAKTIPGYKRLVCTVDLEREAVAAGETIHLGVGPYDTGVRDEYYLQVDTSKLIWFIKPRIDVDPMDQPWPRWFTRCGRYSISRSETFGDFSLAYGKTVFPKRYRHLEAALQAAEIHNQSINDFEPVIECNWPRVLEHAVAVKLDEAPPPKVVEKKVDITCCPKCRRYICWNEEIRFCLDCGDQPLKKKEKKEEKEDKKKGGVVQAIIAILRKRSKLNPISKGGIVRRLLKQFPDRGKATLRNTVGARLADMKARQGINVKCRGGKYYIGGKS